MKSIPLACITFTLLLACTVTNGCKPDLTHQRRISLQSVQAMTSGSIANCDEKYGEVFVSIADNYGDCHIFLLEHPGISNKDALGALKLKKDELDKTRTEPSTGGDGKPAPQP